MMKIQQILDNEAKARSEAINRLVDEVKSLRSELWVLRITAGVAFTALIVSTFVKGVLLMNSSVQVNVGGIDFDVDYYKVDETITSIDLEAIRVRDVDVIHVLSRDWLIKILDAAVDTVEENRRANKLMHDLIANEAYGV